MINLQKRLADADNTHPLSSSYVFRLVGSGRYGALFPDVSHPFPTSGLHIALNTDYASFNFLK